MAYDPTKVEGLGTDELEMSETMPIFRIIQDQAPELKKRDEKYIAEADAGDIMFNPTKELFKELEFVPVATKSLYVEWKPQDTGGGVVAMHDRTIVNDPAYEKGRKKKYDEWLGENELKYTTYIMILYLQDNEWHRGMLAMTSTQLRVSRDLAKQIATFKWPKIAAKPPIFARSFKLTTKTEKNGAGQEYFNFQVSEPRILDFKKDEALLNQAEAAHTDAVETLPSADPVDRPALAEASTSEGSEETPF